jgi:hypothetical protein
VLQFLRVACGVIVVDVVGNEERRAVSHDDYH